MSRLKIRSPRVIMASSQEQDQVYLCVLTSTTKTQWLILILVCPQVLDLALFSCSPGNWGGEFMVTLEVHSWEP